MTSESEMRRTRQRLASALMVGALLAGAPATYAAFEIRKSEALVASDVNKTVFDVSEYSVWVDNTYESVVTYGKRPQMTASPTYGDKMPLSDALKILAPHKWKVMRAKDLEYEGKLVVSWDLQSGTWLDVLRNLGERHAMQFHVDFNRKELFAKNGRRMIFDRPEKIGLEEKYPSATPVRSFEKTPQASGAPLRVPAPQLKASAPESGAINLSNDELNNSAFTINAGDDSKAVIQDLALIFGYDRFKWFIPDQKVQKTQTFTGDATQIMALVVGQFDGRMCLYDADMTAAVIPKAMECPQ